MTVEILWLAYPRYRIGDVVRLAGSAPAIVASIHVVGPNAFAYRLEGVGGLWAEKDLTPAAQEEAAG